MKNSLLILFLLLVPLAAVILGLVVLYHLPLDLADRKPTQPVAFSHRQHAGEMAIDCRFCHRGVEISPVAGIPEVDLCRACHLFIAADRPEVARLAGFWEKEEPIPWIRLYQTPDHVYFPHRMHLRAGLVCAACHGEVADMETTRREVAVKMGWCLTCHRQHGASIDCWTCHR
jgi:hypothetical protein